MKETKMIENKTSDEQASICIEETSSCLKGRGKHPVVDEIHRDKVNFKESEREEIEELGKVK